VGVALGHLWFLAGDPPLVPLDAPPDWSSLDRAIRSFFVQSAFLLKWFGGALAGTALGLVAFGGRLKQLTGGLRPVLDVMLDVDNYLREHPKQNNPRARIVSRYASLLRHVCTWRDGGRGYDRLVIVSHSQGTVITTDLLRYLAAYPDPALAALGSTIRMHVVTMGSPLRQLYGRRFPHLYRWAYHGDAAGPDDPLPASRVPLPAALRIDSWTNLYCSGDYVGRYLWYRDLSDGRWTPLAGAPPALEPVPAHLRREWCVGPGAHTHYWDRSSSRVAGVLDQVLGW
jgi:hypothetical protein